MDDEEHLQELSGDEWDLDRGNRARAQDQDVRHGSESAENMSSSRYQLRYHTRTTADVFFLIPIPGAAAGLELKIPSEDVLFFSRSPVRWLLLIGYGAVGVLGNIVDVDSPDASLALDTRELEPGHIYRYAVSEDAEKGSFHNLNLSNSMNEETSLFSAPDSSRLLKPKSRIATSPVSILQSVSTRDADRCVFGIAYGHDETDISHIMCPQDAMPGPYVSRLETALGISLSHQLDIRNMITLDKRVHTFRDRGKVYILATDARFLRDEDISQPTGSILDASRAALAQSQTRPSTGTYILQMSPEVLNRQYGIHNTHRHNGRAIFSGEGDAAELPRPDAEALHCAYAGSMLARYVHADQRRLVVKESESKEEIESARYALERPK